MTRDGFAGTRQLLRLIVRLDRIKLSLWVLGVLALIAITPYSLRSVLRAEAEADGTTIEAALVDQAALLETNGASIALQGPADSLHTFGGRYAFEIGAFTLVTVAIINILLIARHTRAEEESGRAELVRSAAVGPWSAMAAVSIVSLIANLALTLGTTVVFVADGRPTGPSLLYGGTIGLCGLLFAGIALVWVQVFEYGRAATAMSLAGLVVSFAIRAVGDARDSPISLLSPLGWVQATDPFGEVILWPLLFGGAALGSAGGAAIIIASRRDVGAGLIQQRPGPPRATASLMTPVGFAWRLQRAVLLSWLVGVTFMGAIYGSVISAIDDFVEENEAMRDMLEALGMSGDALREGFITVILTMTALVSAAGLMQSVLRPRGEEIAGRAEPTLSLALSRRAWLGSHLLLTLVAAPIFMLGAGIGLSVSDAMVAGGFTDFGSDVGAALARVPALWALTGIGLLFYGWSRRISMAGWGAFAAVAIIFLFGELLRLPNLVLNLSPLRHVTHLPGGQQGWQSEIVLTLLAVASVATGLSLFERRDIDTS